MSSTIESALSTLSLTDDPEYLALNAIATVTVSGLPTSPSGACPSLTLSRVQLPVLRYTPFYPKTVVKDDLAVALYRLHDGPPARLPSRLPPPGDMHLSLSVDTPLWDPTRYYEAEDDRRKVGTNSRVYSTIIPEESKPKTSLPPLVIKVATATQIAFLVREAALYEEMETIQGIAIPRCYGIFAGWLPKRCILESKGDFESHSDDDSDSYGSEDDPDDNDSDDSTSNNEPGKYGNPFLENYPQAKTYIRKSTFAPKEVYVLLLEKLSGKLAFPLTLWPSMSEEAVKKDIYEVAEDLAGLHIEHCDVQCSNIQTSSPEWSAFCPAHERCHCVRLFDFSHSHKRDLRPERIMQFTEEGLDVVVRTVLPSAKKGIY